MTPALNAALGALLDKVSRKDLEKRAETISAAYRAGGTSAVIAGRLDGLAYLVARMPATYAAAQAALRRTAEAAPKFSPISLLDAGAGPGTVALAAREIWPSIGETTLVEPNATFRALAEELSPGVRIIQGGLEQPLPSADLVTAGYVLAEFPLGQIPQAARGLWKAARDMLVLIEPGTPDGFSRIRAARQALIADGAHVAAPCTHDNACPIGGSDWCHFSQRLARTRDHLIVKAAKVPFEDERYAYLAASRAPVAHDGRARIVKPPIEQKPAISLPVCDSTGLHIKTVARRDKEQFRIARKKNWGDLF